MEDGSDKRDAARVDAVSGATQWKVDSPLAAAIPAPGQRMSAADERALRESAEAADAVTGATPGVASACAELGMNSLDDVVAELGIKPPGAL